MQIANPLYDVVFKYLMEDNNIAKMLISHIIDREILRLDFKPQESILELPGQSLTVYRLDFSARIKTPEEERDVIIEIQKSQLPTDIIRFRKYLGEKYREAAFPEEEMNTVPILTIYFLGHGLDYLKRPFIKVLRQTIDGITGEKLEKKENFIENLTHDSYIIQIPSLHKKRRNELEILLSVFDQRNRTHDHHILNISEEDYPEKYRPLIRRLQKAIAEPEVRKTMDIEDEVVSVLQKKDRQIARQGELLEEKDKTIGEKDKTIEKQARLIEELRQRLDKD